MDNKCAAVVYTDSFSTEFGENGDADPPPGRDLAQGLFSHLSVEGAVFNYESIADNDWEHNNWYFFFRWGEDMYTARIELSFSESDFPKWYVVVTRNVGCIASIWAGLTRKPLLYDQVPDDLIQAVDHYLTGLPSVSDVAWVSMVAIEAMISTD